jgi:hypothetical protein
MFRPRAYTANVACKQREVVGDIVENSRGLRLLHGARELVATAWCRGADARDKRGAEVDPWHEDAVSWSLLGALVAVIEREAHSRGEMPLEDLAAALYALAELIETDSLVAWNNDPSRSQADVLRALDRAADVYEEPHSYLRVSSN